MALLKIWDERGIVALHSKNEKEKAEKEKERVREAVAKVDMEKMITSSILKQQNQKNQKKKKKKDKRSRVPLGVVAGNQAVATVCGGELSAKLKLRRSRRLSGGKNKENATI